MIEALNKNFSDLNVGDRVVTQAKIIQIKEDQKNETPKWFLLTLNDGTKTIRMFLNEINSFKIGDVIEIEFTVREGKPYNGNPQFAYNVHSSRKSEEIPERLLENIKIIIRKNEIRDCVDEQTVKIFTKIITLRPKDGEREKNQKILVSDLENKPISVWVSKNNLKMLEQLEKSEFFILQATVKKMQKYKDTSILSFDSMINGDTALRDETARLFYEARINYYSELLLDSLKLMKQYFPENKVNYKTVNGILAHFRNEY